MAKLTPQEFWGGNANGEESIDDGQLTGSEAFQGVDADKDGFINMEELKAWESGHITLQEALKKLIEMSDKDKDGQVTAAELNEARDFIAESDAAWHFMEWKEHHEL